MAAGGIAPLVALAHGGTHGQKVQAARALGNLPVNADNPVAIARAGGIEPLVVLARGGTDAQKETAARALVSLAMNADNAAQIVREGGIEPLVKLARGGTDAQKENAARAVCLLWIGALWFGAWRPTAASGSNERSRMAASGDVRNA